MKKSNEKNQATQEAPQSETSDTSGSKSHNGKAAVGETYATANSIEMAITRIVVDDTLNVRSDSIDQDAVDRYADDFDSLPPLSVFQVGDKVFLVDGWHRIYSAGKLKRAVVRVKVVGTGSLDDARDAADRANLQHGLPLTRAQRKEVCRRLHARHPKWSFRKLAKLMGVSHPTSVAWLAEEPHRPGKNLPVGGSESKASVSTKETAAAATTTPGTAAADQTTTVSGSSKKTVTCPKCGNEIVVRL